MKKYLTRSNILAVMVTLVLFGYIGITYYKLNKEKVIYVIGMCAKDKSRLNSFHYLKNADDIELKLKSYLHHTDYEFEELGKNKIEFLIQNNS